MKILLRKSDELPGACRNYFEQVKAYLEKEQAARFISKQISRLLHIPLSTVKRHNLAQQAGYLSKSLREDGDKDFVYVLTDHQEYKQLKDSITTVLDNMLNLVAA